MFRKEIPPEFAEDDWNFSGEALTFAMDLRSGHRDVLNEIWDWSRKQDSMQVERGMDSAHTFLHAAFAPMAAKIISIHKRTITIDHHSQEIMVYNMAVTDKKHSTTISVQFNRAGKVIAYTYDRSCAGPPLEMPEYHPTPFPVSQ